MNEPLSRVQSTILVVRARLTPTLASNGLVYLLHNTGRVSKGR